MCVSCGCDCDSHYQHNINTSLSEQTKRGEGIVAVLLFPENSVTIIHHMCAHTLSTITHCPGEGAECSISGSEFFMADSSRGSV